MKILHTADWHIGKIVNQVHMTKDQEYILNQFIEIIQEEKPDVIIIAGDLYDRGVPPIEAVELLDKTFSKILLDLQIPIITIAGNHDSPDRLSFGSRILKDNGLYIEGKLKDTVEKVVLKDVHGPVNFYIIPYADPAEVREKYKIQEVKTHDDAMKVIMEKIREDMNFKERNVAVAHGYVMGAEKLDISESERPLSIGGSDAVCVSYFEDFHYTALGHLHSPQKVKNNKIRYSGSLLKYSFSEVKQKKGITLVELDEAGEIHIGFKELNPLRDMRIIKGKLDQLLIPEVYKETNVEDYLHVILLDEEEIMEPIHKLRTVYPNVLSLEFESKKSKNGISKTSAGSGHRKRSKLDLFQDFYTNITEKEFTEEKKEIVSKIINTVEKEVRGE